MDQSVSDHLSTADTFAMLLERDPHLRSTIVAVATFDRSPDWEVLRDRIERATRLSPRFRMTLVHPPLRLAPPRWVPDPDFDLRWHLRRARVPVDGGRAAVLEFARNTGMAAFDHDRPLWIFTLLEDLPDGRAALVMKVHHSLTDGIGGIQIAQHVVDLDREPSATGPMPDPPTIPDRRPLDDVVEPMAFQLRRSLSIGRTLATQLPGAAARAATNPIGALGGVVGTGRAVAHFVRPVTTTLSPVMRERSLRWHFAELDVPLAPLRDAARHIDCTLNDAFVSAIAAGMRRYHLHHGSEVAALRLSMPVSVRLPDDPEGGNRVTITRFEIPVGLTNPGVRTVEIGRRCQELRADPAIPLGNQIAAVLNLLPVSVTGGMLKHVDVLASNVPGFPVDVFVGGARLESFHPFGPTLGSAANITLMSYAGTCCVGINTDQGAVPDPEVFVERLREGFDEVLSLAG